MVALLQGDLVARFALPAIPGESPPTTGLASVMAVPPAAPPAALVTSSEPRIPQPQERSSPLPQATGVTSEADQYSVRPKTGILLRPPIIDESLSADLQAWTSRTATTSSTATPSASAAGAATTAAATAQQATVGNVKSLRASEPVEESGGIGGTFGPGSEASRSPAEQATGPAGREQPNSTVPLPLLPHLRKEHQAVASQSADRRYEGALPTGAQSNQDTTQMGGQGPSGPSSAAGPLSGVAGSGFRQQLESPPPVAMTAVRGIESRASEGAATRGGDAQKGQSASVDPLAGRTGRSETRTSVPPLIVPAVGREPDANGDEGVEQDYGPLGPLG